MMPIGAAPGVKPASKTTQTSSIPQDGVVKPPGDNEGGSDQGQDRGSCKAPGTGSSTLTLGEGGCVTKVGFGIHGH